MRRTNVSQAIGRPLSPPLATATRSSVERMNKSEPGEETPVPKKLGGLVLTRHLGESIMIGDEVEIEVVGLKSGTARLKIIAPRSIAVHRREVFDQIQVNPFPPRFANSETPKDADQADRPAKPRGGLVLTRNAFQSIMIGDEVEIEVVEVRPSAVKIKIVAPRSISVHRREVFDQIRDIES